MDLPIVNGWSLHEIRWDSQPNPAPLPALRESRDAHPIRHLAVARYQLLEHRPAVRIARNDIDGTLHCGPELRDLLESGDRELTIEALERRFPRRI